MAGFEVCIKWGGKEYNVTGLSVTQTVLDLKTAIQVETGVRQDRQKLLGLKVKGKVPDDDVLLSEIKLRPGTKIMMMGSREEEITKVMEQPSDIPEVVNDFDIEEEEIAIENRDEFLQKIEKRVKDYKIEVLNEPRKNKKLLVLDIDYTLFDHRSVAETANELIRPFLHEFLTSAYDDYDIVIWSATGMKWIEVKMKELGVSTHSAYRICFMIDSLAMISVHTPKYGVIDVRKCNVQTCCAPIRNPSGVVPPFLPDPELNPEDEGHYKSFMDLLGTETTERAMPSGQTASAAKVAEEQQVKPLGVIWGKYPQWGPQNTIMFDDIRRNFIMNPQTGLKIRPFRQAHFNRDKDRELLRLSRYLKDISTLDDFTSLNHRKWEKYRPKRKHKDSSPANEVVLCKDSKDSDTHDDGAGDSGSS